MFANATSPTLDSASPVSGGSQSPVSGGSQSPAWMVDHPEMLLSGAGDVLDYTSFSDHSHSPVLSLQSFESQQHSPDLTAYCFDDFDSLSTPVHTSDSMSFLSTLPDVSINSHSHSNQLKPSAAETARQAALLHAYLAAQNEAYTNQLRMQQEQLRWNLSALAQPHQEDKQQQQQQQQQEQLQKKEQNNVACMDQQDGQSGLTVRRRSLDNAQKSDAENLARYLAQMRQVKEEEESLLDRDSSRHQSMEHADTSEPTHAPSSPSASSVITERSPSPSPSPEASQIPSSPSNKASQNPKASSSRQLICFNCRVTQTPLWRRTPDRQHSLCNACGLYYKQYGAHRPLNVRHKLPTVLADPRAHALPYGRSSTRSSSPSGPESSASSDSDSDSCRTSNDISRSLPDLTKMYTDALLRPTAQKTNPPLMMAKQGIECANCSQTQTPLWRKNEAGEPICNACGLYAKLHKRARPVTMRKSKITRRRRDWGGNLAHQAQAQAQALALFHAQVQAQVEAQVKGGEAAAIEVSMVQEMSRRAQELNGRPTIQSPVVHSSDSEEEQLSVSQEQSSPTVDNSNSNGNSNNNNSSGTAATQKLSGNLIMDEHKFSDMIGQMNAHQMNRFLSILESRCGVLRSRILASTEGSAQDSSLDDLF
ncbi:hypothetical protein BX616_010477 [Lobosporangium transversale]|nr:hypothetical protein BX616_010477 [Lobosporangium transversale]